MNEPIDIKDSAIRCLADRDGAEVFTSYAYRQKPLRVLTFSQAEADKLARNYTPEPTEKEPELL